MHFSLICISDNCVWVVSESMEIIDMSQKLNVVG